MTFSGYVDAETSTKALDAFKAALGVVPEEDRAGMFVSRASALLISEPGPEGRET